MMAMLVGKKVLVPTAGKLLFLLTDMGAMKSTAKQQKSARNADRKSLVNMRNEHTISPCLKRATNRRS